MSSIFSVSRLIISAVTGVKTQVTWKFKKMQKLINVSTKGK